jgi:hypothetical protein
MCIYACLDVDLVNAQDVLLAILGLKRLHRATGGIRPLLRLG